MDVARDAALKEGAPATRALLEQLRIRPAVLGFPVEFRKDDATFQKDLEQLDDAAQFAKLRLAKDSRLLPPVNGGANRQASVLAGLEAVAPQKPKIVLIHDAARPLVDDAVIDGVLGALGQAALPVIPVIDTIKRSDDGAHVLRTEDRRKLFAAQTLGHPAGEQESVQGSLILREHPMWGTRSEANPHQSELACAVASYSVD